MANKDIDIAIIGAGAIGSVFASFLTRGGYNCEIVRYYENQYESDRVSTVNIKGYLGDIVQNIVGCNNIESLFGKKDYIFVMTRTYEVKDVTLQCFKYLKPDGKIVLLENYFTAYDFLNLVDTTKILGIIAEWTSLRRSSDTFEVVGSGEIVVGAFAQILRSELDNLAEILSYVSDVRVSDNFIGDIFSRVIVNSCIGGVGALTGDRLGVMLTYKNAKNIFTNIIREGVTVARACNVAVSKYGSLDFNKIIGDDVVSSTRRKYMYFKLAVANPYTVSSVLRNIENNKRSEIEYLNGMISRLGAVHGIKTPFNDRVCELVGEISSGIRPTSSYNLQDPAFAPLKKTKVKSKKVKK